MAVEVYRFSLPLLLPVWPLPLPSRLWDDNGAISEAEGSLFLRLLHPALRRWIFPKYAARVPLEPSAGNGTDNAVVRGPSPPGSGPGRRVPIEEDSRRLLDPVPKPSGKTIGREPDSKIAVCPPIDQALCLDEIVASHTETLPPPPMDHLSRGGHSTSVAHSPSLPPESSKGLKGKTLRPGSQWDFVQKAVRDGRVGSLPGQESYSMVRAGGCGRRAMANAWVG